MHNEIRYISIPLRELRGINTENDFHRHEIAYALRRYQESMKGGDLGSALAVCANFQEARYFKSFPFTKVTLTGFGDRHAEVENEAKGDSRFSYSEENCERLPFPSRSFDLVFCKEGLHHLARPVLGLYEMLRICRKAVIFVEPYDSALGNMLGSIGQTTMYERAPLGNPKARDNYVFRWNRRFLEGVLNSYYLDSGYQLEMHVGWLSKRMNAHPAKGVRTFAAIAGACFGLLPGARGNVMTALIIPGSSLPDDPCGFE